MKEKLDFYIGEAYNLNSNVVFFPVRHHSPACSFHLKKVIESYNPEIILIEGPVDANKVLKHIGHEETKAPICIYYSYSDSKGLVDENKEKYMCYYPFLDFSPELVAIREAHLRGISAEFIDLSYAEILINSENRRSIGKAQEKNTYNDDYLMQQSTFIKALCEKEGCRSYNELWEKLFEIDGLKITTEKFIKNMIVSCYLSRVGCTEEMLKADGCLARESFMSMKIREVMEYFSRVLVVSGGFHTSALIEGIKGEACVEPHPIPEADEGVYAMAYSFEESDQLNGYTSGMPHPAFYQKVWDNIINKVQMPYEEAVLHFIVRCGGQIKKSEGGLSTADEIEAFSMAKGLRLLRQKNECGVYELFDCIKSAFVKGEVSISTEAPLKHLMELITGKRIGELCNQAEVPPIVQDFRELCKGYRFKPSTLEAETSLYIYKNKKHREQSKFFHRLKFLNTSFCNLQKGPDFINRKNINLIREVWKYKWDSRVESRLFELSVQGGTVKEAADSILTKEFESLQNQSGAASLLLIEAFMMGIEESFEKLVPMLKEILNNDSDYSSVVDCCYNLNFMYNAEEALSAKRGAWIKDFLIHGYNKAVTLIPGLASAPYEVENDIISKLKDIYHIANKVYLGVDSELLKESLKVLSNKKDCNSAVEGASLGILYGMNVIESVELAKKSEEYLYGTGEKVLKSGSFLKGLFSTSKDVLLTETSLIRGINNVMRRMEEEQFLSLVPDLRLSFTFFTPSEIDSIAKKVAEIYGGEKEQLFSGEIYLGEEIKLAEELDAFACEVLEGLGIRTVRYSE